MQSEFTVLQGAIYDLMNLKQEFEQKSAVVWEESLMF